jgi:NACalpha-BTF3-like transcription factor
MLTRGMLQAENLDVSRARATELLKANDADPVKAMRAWVAT